VPLKNRQSYYILLGLHLVMGILFLNNLVGKIITLIITIAAITDIILNSNKKERVLFWVVYFISAEVFFRMTSSLVSWEMIKYVSALLFFIGILSESKTPTFPPFFFVYVLLLLISIAFTDVPPDASIRMSIVFNLSGPILLGVAGIYFYGKEYSLKDIYKSMYFSVLPILSMLVYLYVRTPDLKEVVFRGSANFATSGGFGPNQVSTSLGIGFFALGVLIIAKKKFTGLLLLDWLLLVYIFYRALLTFSRGGLITGVFAFGAFLLFYILTIKKPSLFIGKAIIAILFIAITVWLYTVYVTGGMITNRYLGKNASGVQKEDISSGRVDILITQYDNFLKHPFFGIGVGNGKYYRMKSDTHVTAASHNEVGRIVEEHGLIGVISLFMLLFYPLVGIQYKSNLNKGFVLAFYLIWFLTINHSAMRIALPSVFYGLSLIRISHNEDGF